jgi:hypothetical protein
MKSIPLQNTIYKPPRDPPVRQQLRAAFRSTKKFTCVAGPVNREFILNRCGPPRQVQRLVQVSRCAADGQSILHLNP